MAYFKVFDKNRTDGYCAIINGSPQLFDEIDDIVGDMVCPANGIPYAIEVEGWGELAAIGEIYETSDFVVECISWEEYLEYQD